MGTDNSFLANASSYFNKIMAQTYVEKSQLLQLKKQFKRLKESDERYKPIFNTITGIANNAKGKNNIEILQDVYDYFIEFQSN